MICYIIGCDNTKIAAYVGLNKWLCGFHTEIIQNMVFNEYFQKCIKVNGVVL